MGSLGMWLGSGALMAGVGAAAVCGAGSASADSGADAGSKGPSAHSSSAAHRADRAARTNRVVAVRNTGAADTGSSSRPALPAAAVNPLTRVVAQTTKLSAPAVSAKKAAVPTAGVQSAATAALVPSPQPVDPAQYVGTWYEQGSVKQFFSIGLVNIKAVYSLKPDGSIRVQNSGNYFFNRGPKSSIVGSAIPLNADNTQLNVSFLPFRLGTPKPNYTIAARAEDYSWVIVSDPSGKSGYILTRSKTVSPEEYQQLVDQARALGITGNITRTKQFA